MNLWILTEERPKDNVIEFIIDKVNEDKNLDITYDSIKIIPILNKKTLNFTFTYQVTNFESKDIQQIFIKTVSGTGSFVDFLVFHQEKEPVQSDLPICAIEETKTDDSESRNTGIYQRASKFIYIDYYYPNIDKTMFYNLKVKQKDKTSDSNVFGTRCLRTLGVKIVGKNYNEDNLQIYKDVDEFITSREEVKKTPNGTSIQIKKVSSNKLTISGKLYKKSGKSHSWSDPSIGTLTLFCSILRYTGWTGEIEIIEHQLEESQVTEKTNNKFTLIAEILDIKLKGLQISKQEFPDFYWEYTDSNEKLGSIFLHNTVLFSGLGDAIFENHAGGEKGYFITSKKEYKSLDKKTTDKKPIAIPDLILIDPNRNEIINVEAKQYSTRKKGVEELNGYDEIENLYISEHYPNHKIIRTVVLYGDTGDELDDIHISFLLNKDGKLVLATNAPSLMQESIQHLKDYWKNN